MCDDDDGVVRFVNRICGNGFIKVLVGGRVLTHLCVFTNEGSKVSCEGPLSPYLYSSPECLLTSKLSFLHYVPRQLLEILFIQNGGQVFRGTGSRNHKSHH